MDVHFRLGTIKEATNVTSLTTSDMIEHQIHLVFIIHIIKKYTSDGNVASNESE